MRRRTGPGLPCLYPLSFIIRPPSLYSQLCVSQKREGGGWIYIAGRPAAMRKMTSTLLRRRRRARDVTKRNGKSSPRLQCGGRSRGKRGNERKRKTKLRIQISNASGRKSLLGGGDRREAKTRAAAAAAARGMANLASEWINSRSTTQERERRSGAHVTRHCILYL